MRLITFLKSKKMLYYVSGKRILDLYTRGKYGLGQTGSPGDGEQ